MRTLGTDSLNSAIFGCVHDVLIQHGVLILHCAKGIHMRYMLLNI